MRVTLTILILLQFSAYADMDENSRQALEQTKTLLTSPTERQKAVDKDPKAQDVDKKVDALTGQSGTKEDIYALAAELMDKITAKAQGDPVKMQALMQEAQKDPKAFYEKMLSAEQKQKVREIAGQIDKDTISSGSHK